MARFTLPRDLYHGKGALENLKNLKGKRAIVCVGGGSMKRFGFLDRAIGYLKEAGMEVDLIECIESDPSVETVMAGAKKMEEFRLVIWGMHGIYGAGKTMDETFGLIETVEKAAQIYMLTAHLPRKNTIKDEDMVKLVELFGVKYRKDFLNL